MAIARCLLKDPPIILLDEVLAFCMYLNPTVVIFHGTVGHQCTGHTDRKQHPKSSSGPYQAKERTRSSRAPEAMHLSSYCPSSLDDPRSRPHPRPAQRCHRRAWNTSRTLVTRQQVPRKGKDNMYLRGSLGKTSICRFVCVSFPSFD